jgi:hypothetical protein
VSPQPQGDDTSPVFIRQPIPFIKWWLKKAVPTYGGGIITGLLAIFLGSILTALGGVVVSLFGPTGNVPGYITVIVAGVCLAVGIGVSWALTRKFYELVLRNQALAQATLRAEYKLALEKLENLEPNESTLRRFGIYTEHVYEVTKTMLSGDISLRDLQGDDVKSSVCEMAQDSIQSATGFECKVSIWAEPQDSSMLQRIQGAVTGAVARIPDPVSDAVADFTSREKFEILAAPDHTPNELKDFEVRVTSSWLKQNQREEEEQEGKEKVYAADADHMAAMPGSDIKAFVKHEYQSVRAFAFCRGDLVCYFVVLSKSKHAFTQAEDRYFQWLKLIVEVELALANSGTPKALL